EESDAVGHVAEAPDAPSDHAIDLLWSGVPFEHSAVFELERVVALDIGTRVQLFDLRDEQLRPDQLIQHELDRGAVITTCEHLIRYSPHLRELGVELGDRALGIDNQDAVRG